ncbi:hypothetical protein Q75_13425 [Bacillus coahuilensis p1.1.43]|uniref:SEC-C motif-containing protein n=1 Tax=Bacillus coahuilensis p1.1.43 TaxID=1150625 RepID=A0A147K600_9BACI|nr:SEC-C metal-binding domain-containing protein [Bacillus coahuilensis]KUP05245.1 hypothetical protein Q75_13425 [Bacillus coahuilensis p1.1.43]
MTDVIGRNEPCRCGSGKKYKKCCGANGGVSIEQLVTTELNQLQMQLMDSVYSNKSEDMVKAYQEYQSQYERFTQDEETYEMAFTIWYLFLYQNGQGVKTFVEKVSSDVTRDRTLQALQSWTEAPIVLGKVSKKEGSTLTIQDSLTGEQFIVQEEDEDIVEDTFLVSTLLHYGEKGFSLFGLYFIYPGYGEELVSYVKEYVKNLETDFFRIVDESFRRYEGEEKSESKPKLKGKAKLGKPSYESAITALEEFLKANGEEEENVQFVKNLLATYLERETPSMRNPNVYAAAVVEGVKHYLPKHVNLLQKEIAESFSVSPQSISKKSRDIIDAVQDLLESKEGLSVQR